MEKSPEAFRTISEVADWLGVPAHVLRFWESRFSQVRPVKRAGGRRYYRPNDMLLLGGIRKLLHDDGMTIRGVQKLMGEQGVKHVAQFSHPLDFGDIVEGEAPIELDAEPDAAANVVALKPETAADAMYGGTEDTEALFAASLETEELAEPPLQPAAEAPLFASRRPAPPESAEAGADAADTEPAAPLIQQPDIPDDPDDLGAGQQAGPPPDIVMVMNRLRDVRAKRARKPDPERIAPLFQRMVKLRDLMGRPE